MSKPIVAIIGKPNVGKSTFFNYIVGQRISIVEDIPGVTRDRVYSETAWRDRMFTVVDTAGIEKIIIRNSKNEYICVDVNDWINNDEILKGIITY